MKDPARKYFDKRVTDRERAIFEGAITLGALYHQFVGAAIHDAKALERAMEQAALAQPFIEEARVKIKCPKGRRRHPYIYPELSGEMLTIDLLAKYGKARARVGMRYVRELDYPLMFISRAV
ncbi:MAG: dihydroneopterin aldolase family protein [Candidatus Hodarchaeaceae archaeon]|nr:dihydroneopterin aldolase family protein [Candidatus Hodarchaeaceae archaeon]